MFIAAALVGHRSSRLWNFEAVCEPAVLQSFKIPRWRYCTPEPDGQVATMRYKKRVHKRYPDAKLVKNAGERETYAVKSGDTVLSESANSPTDAWRQAANLLDHPYGRRNDDQP
jgi:hypothetical protein